MFLANETPPPDLRIFLSDKYNGTASMKPAVVLLVLLAQLDRAQSSTVPLIVEGNAPLVVIQVRNGERTRNARFLVDSGGGAVMIGSGLLSDLAIVPAGPEVIEGGDRMIPVAGLGLKVGSLDLDLKDVRMVGLPASRSPTPRNSVEGLIPASVLRKYCVVFDYPGRQFTLSQDLVKPSGARIATPISKDSGFPRIEVEIEGTKFGFLLDTGASFSMIGRTVLERWSKENPQWPSARGLAGFSNMFGGEMENTGLMLRIPEVKIGRLRLRDVAAVSRPADVYEKWMSDLMSAPIIGAIAGNVLRDFRVEIDYRHGVTYLAKKTTSTDADLISVELVVAIAGNGDPVITGIDSGADPTVQAAFKPKDRLIAIDGRAVNGEPLAMVAGLLSGKAGADKKLTILRTGQRMDVTVRVKKLL